MKKLRVPLIAVAGVAIVIAGSAAFAATTTPITTTTSWQIKTAKYDSNNCTKTGTLNIGPKTAETAVNCGSDTAQVRKYTVQPGAGGWWSPWYSDSDGVVVTPGGGSGSISLGEHKVTY